MKLFFAALVFFALMSLITFILYVVDKEKAKQGRRRISERTLLCSSFFGGAVGGLITMYIVRHKTRGEHWYFTFVNVLGVLWQVAALVLLYVFKPF